MSANPPQYTLVEAMGICLAMCQRCMEEVRALSLVPGPAGLGFDDLDITHDGERTFTFKLERGDNVKAWTFVIPCMIDRGVWREGTYQRGDTVSHGGSAWIAQQDTDTKPDTAGSHWRLSVKRGRDGKDGKPGERGVMGPRGEQGQRGFPV